MPDQEVPVPATAPEGTPPALTEAVAPIETALTRTEVASLIAAATAEVQSKIKQDLDAAYKAARRSESKGDTANAKIAKMEATLEVVATRGMDESEARLWKAERIAERATETTQQVSQQQEYEQAQAGFQQRSAAYLSGEGIKHDDPRLTAAFSKYAAEAKTYAEWDTALVKAVADVHKSEARRVAEESKSAVDKAREEERAKLRNEQRASDGKLDKGQPASTSKIDWTSISDEEFKTLDAERTAERLRRQRQTR